MEDKKILFWLFAHISLPSTGRLKWRYPCGLELKLFVILIPHYVIQKQKDSAVLPVSASNRSWFHFTVLPRPILGFVERPIYVCCPSLVNAYSLACDSKQAMKTLYFRPKATHGRWFNVSRHLYPVLRNSFSEKGWRLFSASPLLRVREGMSISQVIITGDYVYVYQTISVRICWVVSRLPVT